MYLEWPLALIVLWAALTVLLFIFSGPRAGTLCLIFMAGYLIAAVMLFTRTRPQLKGALVAFASEYGQVQKTLLREFSLPYAVLDTEGHVLWMNDAFIAVSGRDRHFHKDVKILFPEITDDDLPAEGESAECTVTKDGRIYRAEFHTIHVEGLFAMEDDELDAELDEDPNCIVTLCMYDDTERSRLASEKEDDRLVCGVLSIDNYDEAFEGVEEVRRSLLLALVERKINKYFGDVDGIVRKLEQDKYCFFVRKKGLDACEKNKFQILEDVKTVNIGNDLSLTISIGIGLGADSYLQNADAARSALDLALGRGGDQAVVKDGYRTRFFGGRTESTEKITRVKARVKAHALKEIVESKNRVVCMGHKISDIDSIGAAIGIYRAARVSGKNANIVADDVADSIRPIIKGFRDNPDYDADMFIDRKQAMELTGPDTVVVVVDTNKASYTACEELLHQTNSIVVLDHHRQGDDTIKNAVLSYIEPYASSACEMVAEVLQYYDDSLKLRSQEADAMYGGIVIDTQNFVTKTGVRTFEAAAYLRRSGADITRVRKQFREDMEDSRAKAKAVAEAEVFRGAYAISVCDSEGLHSPTIVAAQAANELLNIVGIKASFVMTDYNDQIYISARSIDEVNVQIIMERLGGGGHLSVAGAQLKDYTVGEALKLLKDTIVEMAEDGDL